MTALHRDGWTLQEAARPDIQSLMHWFPTHDDVNIWGGPTFRYPFTTATFLEDIHWGKMASFSLRDDSGALRGFGQVYDRDERIHLARLVVEPQLRGQGVGRRLIEMLIDAGAGLYPRDEVSLFVYRDNKAAYDCYRSLGFEVNDYPADMPHADVCDYLTRPVAG